MASVMIIEHDKKELQMFEEYLGDAKRLSEPELFAKYAEYLHLTREEVQAAWRKANEPKPNKNVQVPKFDLLTEGYDPTKLKP